MPRPRKVDEKKLIRILEGLALDSKDQRIVLGAVQDLFQIKKEQRARFKSARDKVITESISDKKLQELIDWTPHEFQQEILDSSSKDIVICAGRRFGKSSLCAYIALKMLLKKGSNILLIAPTYGLTDRVMEYLKIWSDRAFPGEIKIYKKPLPTVKTTWGSTLDCRSADAAVQILGKAYDLIIVDECSRVSKEVYETKIVPASGKEIGQYFYISTPFGRNWFWIKWKRAKETGGAFQYESRQNPYFSKEKWEEAKAKLPHQIFQQEYMAIFLADALVFKGIDKCIKGKFEEYNQNHLYITGIDLGRYEDFTVVTVLDLMTNSLVYVNRFKGIDWELQKKRIVATLEQYGNCPAWIDSTSVTVGDAYVQQLTDAGFNVSGYKIHSNIPKRQLIENLVVKIQNHTIAFPEEAIDLIEELRAFSYSITLAGHIRYHAPQGLHDDCVIALALAAWELPDEPLKPMKKGQLEAFKFPIQEF